MYVQVYVPPSLQHAFTCALASHVAPAVVKRSCTCLWLLTAAHARTPCRVQGREPHTQASRLRMPCAWVLCAAAWLRRCSQRVPLGELVKGAPGLCDGGGRHPLQRAHEHLPAGYGNACAAMQPCSAASSLARRALAYTTWLGAGAANATRAADRTQLACILLRVHACMPCGFGPCSAMTSIAHATGKCGCRAGA